MASREKTPSPRRERHNLTKLFHSLVTLAEWFKHDDLTQVAEALQIAPNTVSADLKHLEDQLRIELRTRDKGSRTSHAEELRPLVDDLARLVAALRACEKSPTIRVAMTSHLSRNYLPIILDEVRDDLTHDRFRLAVLDRRADRIAEAVRTGEADVGVAPIDAIPRDSVHVERNHVFQSRLAVISQRQLNASRVSWDDLKNEPLILHERGTATRLAIEKSWRSSNLRGAICPVLEVSDAMLMLELVAQGHGIGITAMGPAIREFVQDHQLCVSDGPIQNAAEVRVGILRRLDVRTKTTKMPVDTVIDATYRALNRELGAPTSIAGASQIANGTTIAHTPIRDSVSSTDVRRTRSGD